MIIIQLQVLWPICRPLPTVAILFSKGKIYLRYAAVVAHQRCSLRLDGTKARLVLWDGEMWSIKLDGDKAYIVHWHPLQGNDFGSHCALRLKYVRFSACYRSTWELICLVASVELVAQLVVMRLVQYLFFPLFPVGLLSNVRTDANCVAFSA